MEINTIDASVLAKMFLNGAKNLESKKEWINELNVFPVPDGDTGTNMTMTIMAAAKEVSAIEEPDMASISKAISSGSLRGARGNSGVILSQLFRGFSKVIKKEPEITVPIMSSAIQKAVETAYKAVMKPKEGTILTVARACADKAEELVDTTDDLVYFVEEVIKEADAVLQKTPDMLPVLKQAGVVDSGGQGLVVVLQGAYDALVGKELDDSKSQEEVAEEIRFTYSLEFVFVPEQPLKAAVQKQYRSFLDSIGDQAEIVAENGKVTTRLHTNDPGLALQEALKYGYLTAAKVGNLRLDPKEAQNSQAEEEKPQAQALQEETPAQEQQVPKEEVPQEPKKEIGFIAVSAGDGLKEIFQGLGVDQIIEGGQTMNPSTEDILNAISQVNASHVFVLPNNKNIILAANQAAALCEDKEVHVIPTKTIPQGITALINYIPEQSVEENTLRMDEEINHVKTGQVTYAVRDTVIDDKQIQQDDYMGIGDKSILSVGKELETVMLDMITQMLDDESAIVSIYYGEDMEEKDASAIAEKLQARFSDIEVEVQYGGQPIYYYMVSVE